MSDVLVSHYRVLRKLGSGGMGDVFLAEDSNLHRQVALKMLRPDAETDPQRLKRFLREAYAASSLNHPNIAVVYEAGQTESKAHYIAMEYVAGEALDQTLSRGPLRTQEVIDLATEIADALDEAHSKGIVHRDLKPSNVMLSARGHAKILDFGIARMPAMVASEVATTVSTDVKSAPGHVLGTLPYASPEQLLGREVDQRSDIFSFGVLLYEMTTGRRPFPGRNSAELAEQICHEQPEAIARLNYDVPGELDRIIRKCIEKDPSSRYQSARDISVDLKNLKRDRSAEPHEIEQPRLSQRGLGLRIAALVVPFAIAVVAGWFGLRRSGGVAPASLDSLAVLPFVSTDPNIEYLSDGIASSVTDTLSELPQVKVMSRTSVFRFKGRNMDPQEIGRRLNVRAIVSGRVAQVGDRYVVDAELLDVADGRQLWGRQFDRRSSDVFAIQGDVAAAISDELRIKLTGEQRQRLAKRYTTDPEAYALYLKGRYYWNKRTAAGLERGMEFFRQAIDKDPGYALAYVGLADCYEAYSDVAVTSPAEWHARARAAVQKALQIDDSVAEAHAALGHIAQADWNVALAATEYRRAIELNPNYATAHHWYSVNLCSTRKLQEGLSEIRKAQQLDPLSPLIGFTAAVEQWALGRDDDAIREYKSAIDLDPKFGWLYTYLGLLYVSRGQCADGIAALRKGVELTDRSPHAIGYLGYGLARCGEPREALDLASEVSSRAGSHVSVALIYDGLGDHDAVFRQLETAYRDRDAQLVNLSWQREYSNLRSDPRYLDLVKRVGIPP